MSIKRVAIKNLLSFSDCIIEDFEDINCIVGINNAGKSNLLKLIQYFYDKLNNKKVLRPDLNTNYSSYGSITLEYNISSRLLKRLSEKEDNNIMSELLSTDSFFITSTMLDKDITFSLTLTINSNDSFSWSVKNKKILSIITYHFPFFNIEGRHISLHNWDKLWDVICSLKSLNIKSLEETIFNNEFLLQNHVFKEYLNYVDEIKSTIVTSPYTYKEKFLAYIKIQLSGDKFLNEDSQLEKQSDGTNAHKYIEIFLKLLIVLTRRDYITPIIYIDEPEIGLHPKKNEQLIDTLYSTYKKYSNTVPFPIIMFSTHSPNILKQVIRLFSKKQVYHFYKDKQKHFTTSVSILNSNFESKFLNIFSDNESRLFFSQFILFVEGESELELFSTKKLLENFSILKKIDIYQSSSNVIGANINPSNLKSSIPFLFLFDADKIYDFQLKNGTYHISLKNKNKLLYILPNNNPKSEENERFQEFMNKYKKGYNKEYLDKYNNMLDIKKINNTRFKTHSYRQHVNSLKLKEFQDTLNFYLNKNNVHFINTTMEELLINHNTKELFFKWLKVVYNINLDNFLYQSKPRVCYIFSYKKRYAQNKILSLNPRKHQLKHFYFRKRRRREEVDNFILDAIRVYHFNGTYNNLKKTLINKKQSHNIEENKINSILKEIKSYGCKINTKQKEKLYNKYVNNSESDNVNNIKKGIEKDVKAIKIPKSKKTSGWVNSFLTFSINELEKKTSNKKDFEKAFQHNFRELYDIIKTIEGELPLDR